MAYSYKGAISFGMVYIPIRLEASVQVKDFSFNQLDKSTGSRIRYKKTCDDCEGRTVENKDIVKAYQYDTDKYVVFDDKDFEKIKTSREKNIVIEQFVSLEEIDPLFFNKPYYVIPTGAEKAYSLLLEAMEQENKVGISKTVLGQKETVIALRVRNGQMVLSTLYFADEIKKNSVAIERQQLSKEELQIASLIIKNMTKPFDLSQYKDEYRMKVLAAIEAKIAGKEISAPKEKRANVLDLMDALRQSLEHSSLSSDKKSAKGDNKRTAIDDKNTAKTTANPPKKDVRANKITSQRTNKRGNNQDKKSAKGIAASAGKKVKGLTADSSIKKKISASQTISPRHAKKS